MKTKRTVYLFFTLCIALLFTACSGKEAASTKKSQTTQTESGTKTDGIQFRIYGRGFQLKTG